MAVFLQNGTLVMGNKTPVSILYEVLNRNGVTPIYELIYSNATSNDPLFKYEVSAMGFSAIGDGRTKKEAKHDAAAGLLRRMENVEDPEVEEEVGNLDAELIESAVASPYTGASDDDYIVKLMEICRINKIPQAEFNSISELGPPHARIFTMDCKLSSCTERAIGRTKAEAKHLAAQQMLSRVEDIFGDKLIPVTEKIIDYDDPEEPSNLKDIESGTFQHDMSVPLEDMHNFFHLKREELEVPEEFFKLSDEPLTRFDELENPKEYLEVLVRKLEGICTTRVISVEKPASPIQNDVTESNKNGLDPEDSSVDPNLQVNINPDVANEQPTLDSVSNLVQAVQKLSTEVDVNAEKQIEEALDEEFVPQVMVFLTIVCPQGKYVFMAIESDLEIAEREASIKALDFLRVMSSPMYEEKSVTDPL